MEILAFLCVLAALVAAVASLFSSLEAKKATIATYLFHLLEYYDASEMLVAVGQLRDWKSTKKTKYGSAFATAFGKRTKKSLELNEARRHVKSYFNRIYKLRNAGILSDKIIKELLLSKMQLELVDLIEPLEAAIHGDTSKNAFFDYYRKIQVGVI